MNCAINDISDGLFHHGILFMQILKPTARKSFGYFYFKLKFYDKSGKKSIIFEMNSFFIISKWKYQYSHDILFAGREKKSNCTRMISMFQPKRTHVIYTDCVMDVVSVQGIFDRKKRQRNVCMKKG